MHSLSLTLLGGFKVARDGIPITRFRGDKVRGLLAYLAVEAQRAHSRASLAALFWPDQPDELALRNLSQSLVRLREALGDDGDALFQITRHSVQWRQPAVVDVAVFAGRARSAHPDDLEEAAARYNGEFLAGFAVEGCEAFEEWLLLTREQLGQLALAALSRLADHHLDAGNHAAAVAVARRQIALDPWRETAHQQLMRALAGTGDRAAALAAFERCRSILRDDLGVEPDATTAAVAAAIRGEGGGARAEASPAPRLPAARTPLVGREEELALLDGLLRGAARLVTISGPGGVGKSRLALAAATILRDQFPDGVCWLSLAAIPPRADEGEQRDSVAGALLVATGRRPAPGRAPLDQLREQLGPRRLLLTLDNCEHLPAVGPLLDELLEQCPGLRVLATSRERLGLPGEELLQLEGLPVPAAEAERPEQYAAVQLFLAEARRQVRDFGADAATLSGVARLCRILAGLPLGLQLAAQWVGHFSCDEIATAVDADYRFLAARDGGDARHGSLRAVFDYSWSLLSDVERQVLARLAICIGQFDRAAAQAVSGAAMTTLALLVDKSLLRRAGTGRYSMHELLRQFAGARLQADPRERAQAAERHGVHFLAQLAARTERLARDDTQQAAAELMAELGNLRQAWLWAAAERPQLLEPAAYALMLFSWHNGLLREATQLYSSAIAGLATAPGAEAGRLEALLLALRGRLRMPQGQHEQALGDAERAIALGRATGAVEAEAFATVVRGMALRRLGRSAEARQQLLAAIARAEAAPPSKLPGPLLPDVQRLSCNWLCSIALSDSDYRAARAYAERNLQICREQQLRLGELFARSDLLDIAIATGDYATARHEANAALGLARALSFTDGEAAVLHPLAILAQLEGDYARAEALLNESLALLHSQGNRIREALMMQCLARLYLATGSYARADAWLGQSIALVEALACPANEWGGALALRAQLAHVRGDLAAALADVEAAHALLGELDDRAGAVGSTLLARILADSGRHAEAATRYAATLARYEALGFAHRAAEAHAGLCALALARGDLVGALAHAEALLPALRQPASLDNPFDAMLIAVRALAAAGDPRTGQLLAAARAELLRRAAGIDDPAWRAAFLQAVPAHRALLAAEPPAERAAGEGR